VIDHTLCNLALRNRALALAVATTGAIPMAATTTGYTRTPIAGTGTLAANAGAGTFNTSQAGIVVNGSIVTVAGTNYVVSNFNGTTGCTLSGAPTFSAAAFTYTGSFIVDGLYAGMEIVPTGFSANTVDTIVSVTARTIITTAARTAEASASGRTLAVGFPAMRAWENAPGTFTPITGRIYVTEEYSPSTHSVNLFPVNHSHADETGMYVLKIFGITGTDLFAIRKYIDGLAALFAPGTVLVAGANNVRIRTDVAPVPGELIPQPGGWTVCALPIHWAAQSINTIAA
jgi:hypothetical protein